MTELSQDVGTIAVLMERFEKQRLPRALALKKKVDQGGLLDDRDIAFLEDVVATGNKISPLIERHPEYKELVARAISLYKEITNKALENEKKV
jgi:hypothetical protein